jgi:hypothetical protein
VANVGNIIRADVLWFKLADDGTNLTYSWSPNGIDWIAVYSPSRTAVMAGGPFSLNV